jgi:lipid-A-disaccharide synthase-like uncharacterized protein
VLGALTVEWVLQEIQKPLVLFGFAGQFIFFLRFAVQWFESERRGRSHIPIVFWYLSLTGGAMSFVYAVLKPDLVFMTAQGLGLLIYIRNLMLIYKRRWRIEDRRRHRTLIASGESVDEATPAEDSDPRPTPARQSETTRVRHRGPTSRGNRRP